MTGTPNFFPQVVQDGKPDPPATMATITGTSIDASAA